MANRYWDSKDGDDANGGTSWGDAVETQARLKVVASTGDSIYILGHGEDYLYNCPTEMGAGLNGCFWYGARTRGGFAGMPTLVNLDTKDGPPNAYSVFDIYFRDFDAAVKGKMSHATVDGKTVKRCVFDSCVEGIQVPDGEDNVRVRHNLFFDCTAGLRYLQITADRSFVVHHNTFDACGRGIRASSQTAPDTLDFDEFHSNIFTNCTTAGAFFDADGSLNFAVGEPNYNVWFNNVADLTRGSKGANKIDADPEFVKAASDDYRLAPGSPALYSDASSKNRGALGPGPTMVARMRHGEFFAKDGKPIEMDTLWRDEHLLET